MSYRCVDDRIVQIRRPEGNISRNALCVQMGSMSQIRVFSPKMARELRCPLFRLITSGAEFSRNFSRLVWVSDELKTLALPPTVEEVESSACEDKLHMKSVVLNEGLRTIGTHAFCMTALKCVDAPSTLRNIRHGAFSKCDCLKEVVLNEGLEMLGDNVVERNESYPYRGVFVGSGL